MKVERENIFSNASDPRAGWKWCHLLDGPHAVPRSSLNQKMVAYLAYMFCLKLLIKPDRPCVEEEDSPSFNPPKFYTSRGVASYL